MDTVIGFLPGNYTLSQQWVIAYASNLMLMTWVDHENAKKQSQPRPVVFNCEEAAGLIVISCDHIHISELMFTGCSFTIMQTLNVTLHETVHSSTLDGLVLQNSGDFSISKSTFSGNNGSGMAFWYTDASVMPKVAMKYGGQVDGSVFAFNGNVGPAVYLAHSEFLVEVNVSYV